MKTAHQQKDMMKYTLKTLLTCTTKLAEKKLITEKEKEELIEIHKNATIKNMEILYEGIKIE